MADQGSGGAYEISQRMTAMMGWGATAKFSENWVWDQAADTYALDPEMAAKLRKSNPQASNCAFCGRCGTSCSLSTIISLMGSLVLDACREFHHALGFIMPLRDQEEVILQDAAWLWCRWSRENANFELLVATKISL